MSFGRRGSAPVTSGNGWTQDLQDEMRGLLRVIKAKDENEFFSRLVLNLNKGLAVAGPALAGTAALASVAGFYRKIQEDIEANLAEPDVDRREGCELFATKVALKLGRSLSDLKQFREMASPSVRDEDINEFAGKLF
jgi:hypothetical protein